MKLKTLISVGVVAVAMLHAQSTSPTPVRPPGVVTMPNPNLLSMAAGDLYCGLLKLPPAAPSLSSPQFQFYCYKNWQLVSTRVLFRNAIGFITTPSSAAAQVSATLFYERIDTGDTIDILVSINPADLTMINYQLSANGTVLLGTWPNQ